MVTNAKQASKFAARSAFDFVGTIVNMPAATIETLATDQTAIVLVDLVVTALSCARRRSAGICSVDTQRAPDQHPSGLASRLTPERDSAASSHSRHLTFYS